MDGVRTHPAGPAQPPLRLAKSERLLYSEPKKLVELGYATTHKEKSGNRSRNVYEIATEGREALGEWTRSRTQPPRIEIEVLLRLLFADHGSTKDLRRALDELEADIREHHDAIIELMASYLDGGHPFPERTHLSVLFATFQIEVSKTIERWIEFARLGRPPRTSELPHAPKPSPASSPTTDTPEPIGPCKRRRNQQPASRGGLRDDTPLPNRTRPPEPRPDPGKHGV